VGPADRGEPSNRTLHTAHCTLHTATGLPPAFTSNSARADALAPWWINTIMDEATQSFEANPGQRGVTHLVAEYT